MYSMSRRGIIRILKNTLPDIFGHLGAVEMSCKYGIVIITSANRSIGNHLANANRKGKNVFLN